MTELIVVKQLPIIEENLRVAKEFVDKIVADAMSLVCTEETVQTVKAARAELNKQFAALEDQRKAVKAAVLDPYNRFEGVYKECVSDAYRRADADLKQKICDVETDMKRRCEAGLREYYTELCTAYHVDFVPFERTGVVVSMTDAKSKTQPPKKLREQLALFVAGVAQSVEMISGMDDAEEIMAEYKRCLDATASIGIVQERHRRIEAEKAARAEREAAKAQEAAAVAKVEAFAPPVEQEQPAPEPTPEPAPEQEKEYRCSFTVRATKTQLKKLKEFMNTEGIIYE
jgi:hypothetical protein